MSVHQKLFMLDMRGRRRIDDVIKMSAFPVSSRLDSRRRSTRRHGERHHLDVRFS